MLPKIPLHTKNEWILNKPRWKWIVHATKALIGATDAHLRWLLVQAGPEEFIRVGREHFKKFEPAIDFTPDELRWMFAVIQQSMPPRYREAMQAHEIARFQRKIISDDDLKGDTIDTDDLVRGHDGPSTEFEDGITTETLPDSEKRIVH